jgi:hypothetical protein
MPEITVLVNKYQHVETAGNIHFRGLAATAVEQKIQGRQVMLPKTFDSYLQ